ncbi:MAG TPA: hypothetical protein VMT34_09235 [Aggregatilineales bacterium]|nr:hypothetical protein [Aggregatilineales bacterium]
MVYKVSYVVVGSEHPGAIMNQSKRPKVGDRVAIGRLLFQIEEIHEMMSARSDFHFLHATVRLVPEPTENKETT